MIQLEPKTAFMQWIEIKSKWDNKKEISFQQLIMDIEHSALLKRLFAGKGALKFPPPLSFSYPNYTLGETGQYQTLNFSLLDKNNILTIDGAIIIDQTLWKIEETITDGERFILSYRIGCPLYQAEIKEVIIYLDICDERLL